MGSSRMLRMYSNVYLLCFYSSCPLHPSNNTPPHCPIALCTEKREKARLRGRVYVLYRVACCGTACLTFLSVTSSSHEDDLYGWPTGRGVCIYSAFSGNKLHKDASCLCAHIQQMKNRQLWRLWFLWPIWRIGCANQTDVWPFIFLLCICLCVSIDCYVMHAACEMSNVSLGVLGMILWDYHTPISSSQFQSRRSITFVLLSSSSLWTFGLKVSRCFCNVEYEQE